MKEGRKECFNNAPIQTYWLWDGEQGDIVFNNAVNPFCVWLYGISHMAKYPQRGNVLLPPHGLLFPISSKGSSTTPYPGHCNTGFGALAGMRNTSMGDHIIVHTMAFVTLVLYHWLE